jgi:hypothetical protein
MSRDRRLIADTCINLQSHRAPDSPPNRPECHRTNYTVRGSSQHPAGG